MTTKTLGQVMYEGTSYTRMPWSMLNSAARDDYERMAQAVAAVVREQDVLEAAMQRNRAELLAEDIEALHLCLDRNGVPRVDNEEEAVYSMWGRVLLLMEATRERCAKACEAERLEDPRGTASDKGYEQAIDDCVAAIRSMKP